MNKIIVTPLYYIDKELTKDIKSSTEPTIIVVDDLSPIFPLDKRTLWVERTFLRPDISVESTIVTDESEEFVETIEKLIKKLKGESEVEVVIYLTKFANKKVKKELKSKYTCKTYKSPLDIKHEELDDVFSARFLEEFDWCIRDKTEDTVKAVENFNVVPYFTLNGVRYFGFLHDYSLRWSDGLISGEVAYKTTVANTRFVVGRTAELYANSTIIGNHTLLGWLYDENVWLVPIEVPAWIRTTDDVGLRRLMSNYVDLFFVKEKFLKDSNSVTFHWIANKVEELDKEKEESE